MNEVMDKIWHGVENKIYRKLTGNIRGSAVSLIHTHIREPLGIQDRFMRESITEVLRLKHGGAPVQGRWW